MKVASRILLKFYLLGMILLFPMVIKSMAKKFDYESDALAFELVEVANNTFRSKKNMFAAPVDFRAWNALIYNARAVLNQESKNLIGTVDEHIMRVFTELEACNAEIESTIFRVYDTYVKGKSPEQVRAGVSQIYTLHSQRARVERQSGDSQLLKLSMSRSTLKRKIAAIRFVIKFGDLLQELCMKAITDLNTFADGKISD